LGSGLGDAGPWPGERVDRELDVAAGQRPKIGGRMAWWSVTVTEPGSARIWAWPSNLVDCR
jgi:hypothetical protein